MYQPFRIRLNWNVPGNEITSLKTALASRSEKSKLIWISRQNNHFISLCIKKNYSYNTALMNWIVYSSKVKVSVKYRFFFNFKIIMPVFIGDGAGIFNHFSFWIGSENSCNSCLSYKLCMEPVFQPGFFFRLSFDNCIHCADNCNGHSLIFFILSPVVQMCQFHIFRNGYIMNSQNKQLPSWLDSSIDRVLYRYSRGLKGFESNPSLNFSGLSFRNSTYLLFSSAV